MTETSATLEATVDPNGLETTYELRLLHAVCQNPLEESIGVCLAISLQQVGQGRIEAGEAAQSISVVVPGLQPGYVYGFQVVVTNSDGESVGREQGFVTLLGRAPETLPAAAITPSSAVVRGRVMPEELPQLSGEAPASPPIAWSFELAPGPRCTGAGQVSTPEAEEALAGEATREVEVTGLAPGTEYTVCLVETRNGFTMTAPGASFTTAPESGPPASPVAIAPLPLAPTTTDTLAPIAETGAAGAPAPSAPASSEYTPATHAGVTRPASASARTSKLARAMRICKQRRPGRSRAACKRRARRRYVVKPR
ncbi:MAG TPA: hypothetical protein VMA83_08595 [Solirubrobacteraceae bacterium]|nr:hypothetical protein [Solirubrobacteraceae bacterium]